MPRGTTGFPSDWPGLAAGKRLPLITDGGLSNHGVREAPGRLGIRCCTWCQTPSTRQWQAREGQRAELTLPTGDCMAGPAGLPSSSFHKENYMVGGGSQEIAIKGFSPLAT